MAGVGAGTFGLAACSDSSGDAAQVPAPSGGPSENPSAPGSPSPTRVGRRFGAEWEPHARTFMSWPASTGIWDTDLPAVRTDIARLARAIAATEPLVMLARPDQADAAESACGSDVEVVPIAVDDLWARDTAPVFVEDGGRLRGVDLDFNGWGDKQAHANDALVAREVLARYGISRDRTWIVGEGGALETDGAGTLLATESSLVNTNRNPDKTRQQIEDELKRLLGVTTMIWFDGVRGQDITDAHVDALVRFVAPGVVLLDTAFPGEPEDSWSMSAAQARSVLKDATDARGKTIEVVDLPQPDPARTNGRGDDFLSSYANFYIGNKAVFFPKFGDGAADDRAGQILKDHFPTRDIVPVRIDVIASGGGGIHCATHDQPTAPVA
ncbi:peptidyl-arginine deiminase [Embleya scabrispora]|uniref:Peptidyl-arginine deiminase n=1 Tax=Embleya scabrispora TaxID=159449 RepID=A0A1T3NIP3_9ACTN|nr:agmatine deiminase family protein [Embleya scabrispora]OPC76595.1 peptidyl-arginine deiminase [Embleya scabrispora]